MGRLLQGAIGGLVGLGAIAVMSVPSVAQGNPYSAGSRATFLTGCLQENAPDYNNDAEVVSRMRMCVCLLDRFQGEYTNPQFTQLFVDLDRKVPAAEREVDDFLTRHISDCL
ncbi:MAG: hypothetical protein AAFY11_13310 [Cyanobacteria bacterium J06641_5]